MSGLFGHCPNSDCTPPLHSNGHSGALYFRTDLSKCHLNFNFHCISAPNHPGKGSDPPNQANAPLNMDNSSQNKCPKPFGQGSRPPPPFGQCPNRPGIFLTGASLTPLIKLLSKKVPQTLWARVETPPPPIWAMPK